AACSAVPVFVTAPTSRGAVPLFVTVRVCAALVVLTVCEPKVRLAGDTDRAGATPAPVSATLCGLPAAFEAIDTEAVFAPVVVGLNVTETVQLPPAATVVQVLVCANWSGFVPPS